MDRSYSDGVLFPCSGFIRPRALYQHKEQEREETGADLATYISRDRLPYGSVWHTICTVDGGVL